MFWFKSKEKRSNEPHIDVQDNVCTEVQTGLGLLQKILNLKEYGAMNQSAFFDAINLISNSIAQMSWELKSYNQDEHIDNKFLKDIFYNSQLTQFMIVKNMIKDVLLHGNGFCYIERDKKGSPISLRYLPYGECNVLYNKVNDTLFYQVPRLTKSLVEPINIIHIRMLTNDGYNGISILDYANSTIKLSASAEKAAHDFFNSGMTVQGILSTESPRLTKDQRNSIRESWNESQLGKGSGIAVLENGMKYQAISSNSKDAQLVETRLYNVQEIARFFGMSPVMLGDLTKTSYNAVEQAQLAFVLNCLASYITMLEQEINNKLILTKDRYKYYIDIIEEDIIKGDKTSQANYLGTLIDKAIITTNEARQKLGLPPVEGGDELYRPYTDINQNKINQDKNTEEQENEEQS